VNEQTKAIIDRARALLAAATPGPVTVYPHPRPRQDHDESRFQWGDLVTGGRSMWTMIPMADAEALAFAVNNLGAICDALEAAERRAKEAEAQCETVRAEFAALGDHFSRNVLILNDVATQVCCTHFERLPEAVRELVAGLHAAEARATEDEQLRLRLARALAAEEHQHKMTRESLAEARREVDGLCAERASVDAGVCQSCVSAWWAREHDQNAAKAQVAAAEAVARRESAQASIAQMTTNAAIRDLTAAASENARLQAECDALRAEVEKESALRAELTREVQRLRARVDAVGQVLAENGCDCECGCHAGEHDDDCDRCLACRVQDVIMEGGAK
jgi:hypothetical protein